MIPLAVAVTLDPPSIAMEAAAKAESVAVIATDDEAVEAAATTVVEPVVKPVNVVVEPAPKRVLKRRKVIQPNA